MKKSAITWLASTALLLGILNTAQAQLVPVTFHFDPPTENFSQVFIAGTFNGWQNNQQQMTDADGDGVYEVTIDLPAGNHQYKFVLDADWGKAFTDPDNPLVNEQDNNNSMLTVADPMVTYLLPKDGSIDTTQAGHAIRAIFAFTAENPIDPATLVVKIDGDTLENAAQYYDAAKREFLYTPDPALATGEHTLSVSALSSKGVAARSATFTRNPHLVIYKVPLRFVFDANTSRLTFAGRVNSVALVGDFNQWNSSANPMRDEDGDGVWETTITVEEGVWEYKFFINGILWLTDPENPVFNPDDNSNSVITAVADSLPRLRLLSPAEGTIYTAPATIDYRLHLFPGVKGGSVDEGTIVAAWDGAPVGASFTAATGELSGSVSIAGEGAHALYAGFSNSAGVSVAKAYPFGLFAPNSGFHAVDAAADEQYAYPAAVPEGSADIREFHILPTAGFDSLEFRVHLADITDNTRLGLVIVNPQENAFAEIIPGIELEAKDWDAAGVLAVLAPPGNAFENSGIENRWQLRRNPAVFGAHVPVNAGARDSDILSFRVALAYLDSVMGSWTRERDFVLFSYLVTASNGQSYEVGPAEGGKTATQDADVYDLALVRSSEWQKRLLDNFIPTGNPGGPRLSRVDAPGRGVQPLKPGDISDSLATGGADIVFLTPGVTYWRPDVTVAGTVSDTSIATATFIFNGESSTVPVINGKFEVQVVLVEGQNVVRVEVLDQKGVRTQSSDLILTLQLDHDPWAEIQGRVEGRKVFLQANAVSPDSLTLFYNWIQDLAQNPAVLQFSSRTAREISFTVPEVDGEYFVNVNVIDVFGRKYTAGRAVIAKGDSIRLNTLEEHPGWVDDAVIYEIFPRSFSDQGGFAGITERLDDLLDLGITAIWLMPIFEGPTTHGYEITDYFATEADYGSKAEFKTLVREAHRRGIKIILDYVVNHTSVQHPFMQNVLQFHEYSPWADWYLWNGEPGTSSYQHYPNWSTLPNLNMNNPDVRKYFIEVAEYWVREFDIDGFRCDVAWGVQERNGQFWQEWRRTLKNIKPGIFLLAEASSLDFTFFDKRFDSAYDLELRNRIIDVLNVPSKINSLDAELRRPYPEHALPFRFMENHDEVRVAASHDVARSKLSHTVFMMANGVPLIYAGGEVGETSTRGRIDWSDPFNLRPFFKRLIDIRRQYVHQLQIGRIANTTPFQVYTFLSQSGEHHIITALNFTGEPVETSMDLSGLPQEAEAYYLSELLQGTVTPVDKSAAAAHPLSLEAYGIKIFYYGPDQVTGVETGSTPAAPDEFGLSQNYPNPFNPETRIAYTLPAAAEVTLKIYNIRGQEVRRLVAGPQKAGHHIVLWDGRNAAGRQVATGVYLLRLRAGDRVLTRKMLLAR